MKNLSHENRLLIQCLNYSNTANHDKMSLLSQSDWHEIIKAAIRHSIAPQLYHNLEKNGFAKIVSEEPWNRLYRLYALSLANNIRLYQELSIALNTLTSGDIPVIVLKGGHLGEIVYNNIGLRVLTDFDLLVREEDVGNCKKILSENGFFTTQRRVLIDIHWHLDLSANNLSIDMESVWQRAESGTIAGVNVHVLSPVDLLNHLCTHLAFHHQFQYGGLKNLIDIKAVIDHYGNRLNWESAIKTASEWGVSNVVYTTLFMAKFFVDANVPDYVLDRLSPTRVDSSVIRWAANQLFVNAWDEHPRSPYFWNFLNEASVKKKISLMLSLLFPDPKFISQKYPSHTKSLYNYFNYAVRFNKHFKRYMWMMWQILRKDKLMLNVLEKQKETIAMMEWFAIR